MCYCVQVDRPIAPPPQPGDRVPKEKKKKVPKKKKKGPKRNWIGRKSKVSKIKHWGISFVAG